MRRAAGRPVLRVIAGLAFAFCFGVPSAVDAQTAPSGQPAAAGRRAGPGRSFEASGGIIFVGGHDFGSRSADLTSNEGGTTTLFDTDSELKPTIGLVARLGVFVTRALAVEAGLRYTRPVLEVRVSDDFENAPDITTEETQSHYVFEGTAVWHFRNAPFTDTRTVPFIYGGLGYLRELHEEDTLVDEGIEYHAGGGVKWWLGAGRRRFGVRAEFGFSIRDVDSEFEDGRRVGPVAGASLIYLF